MCLLYEFKLGTSAVEAARKVCEAFGHGAISERVAQYWYAKFKTGDECTEDRPRSGRPTIIDDAALQSEIEADQKQSCQELAYKFGVGEETIREHLHIIGKTFKLSKWVPHELSAEQKQQRLAACETLLTRQSTAPFLDSLVTCDEKWIFHENTKQFRYWSSRGEPPKKFLNHLCIRRKLYCVFGGLRLESFTMSCYCLEQQ